MALYSYVYERPASPDLGGHLKPASRGHLRRLHHWPVSGVHRGARNTSTGGHNWAVRSRLQPMIEVARMLKRQLENIITYLWHGITQLGQ